MKDGGPAYPVTPTDRSGQIGPTCMGMSYRDHAIVHLAAAWVGVLAAELRGQNHRDEICIQEANYLAAQQADALIALIELKEATCQSDD
jgi:hypothetical protein